MKKLIIFVCVFILLSFGANAADRDYYKLEKGAMVFANPLQINRFIELMPEKNVATEYFDDLLKQKVATQTHEEVIVYKFDKFSHGSIDCYRVKVKNTSVVKFLNTYTDYISNVNYKEGDIIGWVFGITLKKVKQK